MSPIINLPADKPENKFNGDAECKFFAQCQIEIMAKTLFQRIFQNRTKVPKALREALEIPRRKKFPTSRIKNRGSKRYIKGVNNGNYFRMKLPEQNMAIPNIGKIPNANPLPKPFKAPIPPATNAVTSTTQSNRFYLWLKTNLPILCLNFGSICILVGFSRSEIIELRCLSMTGQLCFVFYNLGQPIILWPAIGWSLTFAGVNAFKISEILHERNAEVKMNQDQEKLFVEHFMPHGVTPKQFERIEQKATKFNLKNGEYLIRKGDKLDHVYLVIEGSTQAHILGRHLTAASTNRKTKGDQKMGGDSGVWAGEVTFLESFGSKHTKGGEEEEADSIEGQPERMIRPLTRKNVGDAWYTIVAAEDCTILSWSHSDLEELMESSTDLRGALTRAMTSALVGKVVNLTISRQDGSPNKWAGWLSDWKNNDGASVQVRKKNYVES